MAKVLDPRQDNLAEIRRCLTSIELEMFDPNGTAQAIVFKAQEIRRQVDVLVKLTLE